jgi:biopolymer transport protein ExbB
MALMKQALFTFGVLAVAFIVSFLVYKYMLPDYIRLGGPLVVVLMTLSILALTFIVERLFTLQKARGRLPMPRFTRHLQAELQGGKIDKAIELCHSQRGSLANVVRAGLERYRQVVNSGLSKDEKIAETRRAIEEANMLEVPLLERNLIALSTIASISTMVGLLGTTIGMIRSFRAMAHAGAPDAVQLAVGISEALINTAGGLFIAIAAIVAYNVFTTKVDNFNYMLDEAAHEMLQILHVGEERHGKA